MDNWKFSKSEELPDFIIGGAMKSGTTTLHHILNSHPDIEIPKGEIGFFDIDNIIEHSDFNFFNQSKKLWFGQNLDSDPKMYWDWYLSKFSGEKGGLKGEDSTTYLASSIAAKRIALQDKKIKMIFILRQPTLRAYSHYFHLVRSERTSHSFEDLLQKNAHSILNRSLYKKQLEAYYKYIPQNQIKVILFEDLFNNLNDTILEISSFLNIDFSKFNLSKLNTHQNKAYYPKYLNLHLLIQKHFANNSKRYLNNLPNSEEIQVLPSSLFNRISWKIYNKINPKIVRSVPPINIDTKNHLDQYFKNELEGLDSMIGKDINKVWFTKSI